MSINSIPSKYQIVVARYDEDIKWTLRYSPHVIIYNKGMDDIPNAIKLPNVGRESHTYLYHIIHNYYNLADRTVFVQGTCPSFGYQGKGKGGHLFSNYYFEDYILSQQSIELIVTSCITKDLNKIYIRKGYDEPINIKRPISRFPNNTKNDHWLPYTSFNKFKNYLLRLKKEQKGHHTLESFWTRYISDSHRLPDYIFYNQGAQFSVSKEVIQQYPLSYYQELIKEVSDNRNPYQGYYMEWFWPYLLSRHVSISKKKEQPQTQENNYQDNKQKVRS